MRKKRIVHLRYPYILFWVHFESKKRGRFWMFSFIVSSEGSLSEMAFSVRRGWSSWLEVWTCSNTSPPFVRPYMLHSSLLKGRARPTRESRKRVNWPQAPIQRRVSWEVILMQNGLQGKDTSIKQLVDRTRLYFFPRSKEYKLFSFW